MTGRNKAEGGKEGKEEEEEVRQVEKVTKALLAGDLVNLTISGDLAGTVEEMCGVARGSISTCGSLLGLFAGGERAGGGERWNGVALG